MSQSCNHRPAVDYRCYFVTGRPSGSGAASQRNIVETAAAAAQGGAGVIQVRSKPISARELYELSQAVAEAVEKANPSTRVLIDDRLDVALALRSEGVAVHGLHIGQDDLPAHLCREMLGPDAILGLTTGTFDLVAAANEQAAYLDYIGCGPFRTTPTKDSGRRPLGLSGYPELVALSQLPVVAIGDITADDAAELAATGVSGLAVVRALMHADDPAAYAAAITRGFMAGAPEQERV